MSAKELNRKWFLVPGDAKIGLWLAGWLDGWLASRAACQMLAPV